MPVWGCYRHHSHTYKPPPPPIFFILSHFSIFFLQIATSARQFLKHPLLFPIFLIFPKKIHCVKFEAKRRGGGYGFYISNIYSYEQQQVAYTLPLSFQ